MTTRKPWTTTENSGLASLYFEMLDRAQAGEPYNKAAMIRSRQGRGDQWQHDDHDDAGNAILRERSRGSIEAKLMNASAAHRDLGTPVEFTMDPHGYRCLPNYQAALRDAMRAELQRRDRDFVAEQLS